ncbi:hypothetical protein FQA39_LY12145 [Lamprigera yunnana]|nr:hypothetical protein FQA39_LY12145 [Lamprigera yunnana]
MINNQGDQHQLNIKPAIEALLVEVSCNCHFEDNDSVDVYPTYPCVDKTVKFHIQKVLPAVWTKTPGLTLPSWDKTMPQFDNLDDCLNENWINSNSKNQSIPTITYRSLKFYGPTMTFKRTQDRSLPNIPDPEENKYLELKKINPKRGVPRTSPNSPISSSKLRARQMKHSVIDDTKNYINLPQTERVK